MKAYRLMSHRGTFSISENKSKRTFTIRLNGNKYRTTPMNREEFLNCQNMTGNDWCHFLDTESYSVIK